MVVDGGNSNFGDSVRRAAALAEQGIGFVDAGTSGGVWGLDERLRPDGRRRRRATWPRSRPSSSRSPRANGFAHVGPVGAGPLHEDGPQRHRVRDDAGLRRGLRDPRLPAISTSTPWRRCSRGRRAASCGRGCSTCWCTALDETPGFEGIRGVAADSGEGRWTVNEAVRLGVAAPVISAALFARFVSQDEDQLDDEGHRRPAPPVRRPHLREGALMAPPLPSASKDGLMRRPRDGVVLFGATGDLAAKKLYPALYELGRTSGSTSRSSACRRRTGATSSSGSGPARASRPKVDDVDGEGARPPAWGGSPTCPATTARPTTFDRLAELVRSAGIERPLFYLAIPPGAVRRRDRGPPPGRAHRGRAGRGREAVRPRPRRPPASSTSACTGPSPRRRSTASTTSSGRSRSRTCSCSGSPTRCSSRVWNRNFISSVQITMAEDFGVGSRGKFYETRRCPARRRAEPPPADRRPHGDGAAGRGRRRRAGRREDPAVPPGAHRSTRPTVVRGQYRGYANEDGRAGGVRRRDLRGAALRDRLVALGGRARG